LTEPEKDVASDYTGEIGEQLQMQTSEAVSEKRLFYDEHWSRNRLCTSLDWSPQVKF
jgi:dynein intermediate chain